MLSAAAAIIAATIATRAVFDSSRESFSSFTRAVYSGSLDPIEALSQAERLIVRALLPVALAALVAAMAVGALQTKAQLAPRAFGFRKALRRNLIGWPAGMAIALAFASELPALTRIASIDSASAALTWIAGVGPSMLGKSLLLLSIFGIVDWLLGRAQVRKSLWMSRDEIERERREDEVSLGIKAEQRRLGRDRSK